METDISKRQTYNSLSHITIISTGSKHKRTGKPHANFDDSGKYFVRYLL